MGTTETHFHKKLANEHNTQSSQFDTVPEQGRLPHDSRSHTAGLPDRAKAQRVKGTAAARVAGRTDAGARC